MSVFYAVSRTTTAAGVASAGLSVEAAGVAGAGAMMARRRATNWMMVAAIAHPKPESQVTEEEKEMPRSGVGMLPFTMSWTFFTLTALVP